MKQYTFFYFKNSLYFLVTSKIIVVLHLIIEYLDIYTHVLDSSIQLLHYNETYNYSSNSITKGLFYISPYYYFTSYLCKVKKNQNQHKEISLSIVIVLIVLYIIILIKQTNIKITKISFLYKVFITFYINFYDYLFFRTLSIIPLHTINECLVVYAIKAYGSYNPLDIFIITVISLIGLIVLFIYLKYYLTFNILSTFKFHETCFNDYPFDHFFSRKYDIALLFVKILIATSTNYLEANDHLISSFQIFINVFILIVIFSLSLRILYHFFINNKKLSSLLLNESNVIRVFLLQFTCVSVILRLMFNNNDLCIIFLTFGLLMFVFLLYIIIVNYGSYITSHTEMSNDYFGVCWFFQSNSIDRNKFIMQWVVHHRALCKEKNCQICLKLNEEDLISNKQKNDSSTNIYSNNSSSNEEEGKLMRSDQLYSSSQFVYLLYNEHLRTMDQKSAKEEQYLVDMIYLSVLFLSQTPQLFKLYSFVHKLEQRYKHNTNVLLTILMSFDLIKKAHNDIIKTYKLVTKSENLNNAIKDYIHSFNSFLHYDKKTPENVLKISNKFMKIKENRKEVIKLIKKDVKCNYQTRINRYLYEVILRTPLKLLHVESEIYSSEEYLDMHYNNDQLCILRYNFERKTFCIIKASKDLMKYKSKAFNALFPDFLKERNEEMLIEKLKNCDPNENRKLMSFVVKDLKQSEEYGFVQDFKMVFSVFPSIVSAEILVAISYVIDYEDILIFEIPNEKQEECLYSFSNCFLKILGLTPQMLQLLTRADKIITYQDLFSKKSFDFQLGNNSCSLNYSKYARFYSQLMKYDGLNEAHNFSEIKENVNKILDFGKQQKELRLNITEKFINENVKSKYIIYNLVENNKEKDSKRAKDIPIIGVDNEIVIDPLAKFDHGQTTTLAPTISNFSTDSCSSAKGSLSSNYKKRNHKNERKEKYKQVHYFTMIILFFGLFLMILTLVFLILEVNKNSIFQSLFNLFQIFKQFKLSIEAITLSIISNFCLEKLDNTCVNYFDEYSKAIKKEYPALDDYPNINEIISTEVNLKADTILNSFNLFLNEMHIINFVSINEIGTFKLTILNIKKKRDEIAIDKTESSFLDLVRLYSNYITSILSDNAYLKEGVRIMIVSSDGDINSEDKLMTEIQRNLYRLILNYPCLHNGILRSSNIIETEFENYLKEIYSILMAFFLVLLFLHLLLCFFAIWFLKTFIQMLKSNIGSIIDLFSNQTYLTFIENRMKLIQQLCELYSDNPIRIIHSITEGEEVYKKIQRDQLLTQKQDLQNNNQMPQVEKIEYSITKKEFNKLVIHHKVVIITLFTVYFIYSISYYVVLNNNYIHLEYLVLYSSINSLIDNCIYNNVLAIQYIILTNSTSHYLSGLVYDNDSIDYIQYGIESLYDSLKNKEMIEATHNNIFPSLHQSINMNCSQFQIDDDNFKKAFDKLGNNYNTFLKTACEYYQFHMLTSDDNLIKEMLYMSNQLINKYSQGTYDELIAHYDNRLNYDLYSGLLIFVRITRTYFNEHFFSIKVNEVLNSFTVMIIIYLVLNMLLEVVIFLILNFVVISKIKLMNRKLFLFINSLKY